MSLDADALGFALRLARIKALQLHRRLHWEQMADIEQDLLLAVVEGWKRYDPKRGRAEPFIESVMRQGAWKLIDRYRHRGRLGIALTEGREPAFFCRAQADLDLQLDVGTAMASLAPEVREGCARLHHEPVSTAARTLNLPRSTLDSWLHKARSTFTSVDLHRYR